MPNEELRERNVRNVLEKAVACFNEMGFETATMTEIANRAGVTARSIQRYFGTKDNLIQSAITSLYEKLHMEMRDYVESRGFCGKNGFDQVVGILMLRTELARRNPNAINSMTEYEVYRLRQVGRFDIDINNKTTYHDYIMKKLREALLKGITDGSIRPDTDEEAAVDLLALAFKGLLQRLSLIYANGDAAGQIYAQKYADAFIRIAAETLQPKAGEERA